MKDQIPAPAQATVTPEDAGLQLRSVEWGKVKPVTWLLPELEGRIPRGKPSLLVAEESGGKGTLECYWINRYVQQTKGRVLVIGDEDGFEDTWVPRLRAAGMSEKQIEKHVLTLAPEDVFMLVRDHTRLTEAVQREGVGWIIFDQLLDHLDGGRDGAGVYNPKHVRDALRPLRLVAQDTGAAVTGNLHPIKGNPKSFRDLIGASHQFNAVARVSLWLGHDPDSDDPAARVVVRGKGNLTAEPPNLEFTFTGKKVKINGETFDMPVVKDMREGGRYRHDFEGDRGAGFGKRATVPASVRHAEALELILTEEPQSVSSLARQSGVERSSASRALAALAEDGRAEKINGKGYQRINTEGVDLS